MSDSLYVDFRPSNDPEYRFIVDPEELKVPNDLVDKRPRVVFRNHTKLDITVTLPEDLTFDESTETKSGGVSIDFRLKPLIESGKNTYTSLTRHTK